MKKLKLNKRTISSLSSNSMQSVRGGGAPGHPGATVDKQCVTAWCDDHGHTGSQAQCEVYSKRCEPTRYYHCNDSYYYCGE